jgi:uncharacterized RDD family membrane protein YckC
VKCPKCSYIGFEAVDRCRNCGYEFALAVKSAPQPAELEMRSPSESGGPLVDLSLIDAQILGRRRTPAGKELDLDRIIGAPETSPDLPLFGPEAEADDMPPLVSAPPRKPLAVRRMTPLPARQRPGALEPQRQAATRNLELPLPVHARSASMQTLVEAFDGAAPARRVLAAAVDVAILGAIDILIIYFTLRLCELSLGDAALLPTLPLAAFFLLLNGGYLVAFTSAGGQTIGKMAFGLKVVGPGDETVSLATATLRSAGCVVSAMCLGAGLVPALLGRRALHDRLTDTRVVQVTV